MHAFVPAAQYLRMSTEMQQYSLDNQRAAIGEFAALHGYEIVRTYADPGKSGLHLRNRPALNELLTDVLQGRARYNVVLVYDVSRWGRFQDNDEAACYEFLCKRAGIPVIYCAEPFSNDANLPSLILKALKRTMAGEYSRELSQKIFEYQKRMVLRGFKVGGTAGYGLRRMLVSQDQRRNRILRTGEYKGLHTDRVVWVLGPSSEVAVVREIFSTYVGSNGRKGPTHIASELNRRGIPSVGGRRWDEKAVVRVLTNLKYTGASVWGRTSQRLGSGNFRVPCQEWIVKHGCTPPIIDCKMFERAQRIRAKRRLRLRNEDLLNKLRRLFEAKGDITRRLIDGSRIVNSMTTYRKRFGNLETLCSLLGHHAPSRRFAARREGLRTERLRDALLNDLRDQIVGAQIVALGPKTSKRRLLQVNGVRIALLLCHAYHTRTRTGWRIHPIPRHPYDLALLCRLDDDKRVIDHHLCPRLTCARSQIKFYADSPFLLSTLRIAPSAIPQIVSGMKDELARLRESGEGSRPRRARAGPHR